MTRNTILLLLLLAGVAATGLLLLLFAGSDRPVRREASGYASTGSGRAPQGRGLEEETGSRVVIPVGPERGTASMRKYVVTATDRKPFDSPETIAARRRYAARVVQMLDEMMAPDLKYAERQQISREMQKLLRLMGHRVSPAVRERLLDMLVSVEPRWRMMVGETIGSLQGDTDTAKALVDMLLDEPDHIRTRHAIYAALGKMNVSEVAPQLMAMLGTGRDDEHLIVRTIGNLAGPKELDTLFTRLDQPLRSQTRREIEMVLTQKGRSPGLMDKIAKALDGADLEKRRSLLRILASSRQREHAATVRDLLKKETDPESRRLAIRALGEFGDAESGKVLLDLVKSGSQEEQRRAVLAIHAIKVPETVSMLARSWETLDQPGRLAVMGAAARLQRPSADLTKLAKEQGVFDADLRVRTSAAQLLGKAGGDENVDPLVRFLGRAKHPNEISTALGALEQIGTKRAAEEAIAALNAVTNERRRASWMKRFEKIRALAVVRPQ